MGSVIVKGMEMPKNCNECDLSKRWHSSMGDIIDCKRIGTVGSAFDDPYMILVVRHPNCPLVEIPTPHGRLIDADAIQDYNVETFGQRLLIIDTAPTVIEAEGSEA